jgi:hypothetical protein
MRMCQGFPVGDPEAAADTHFSDASTQAAAEHPLYVWSRPQTPAKSERPEVHYLEVRHRFVGVWPPRKVGVCSRDSSGSGPDRGRPR